MSIKTAVILAAGKGTRLDQVTGGVIPKPLTPIEGKPLIEYSIEVLINSGVQRIFLGCGHLIERFHYLGEKYEQVNIVENSLYDIHASIYTLLIFNELVKDAFYLLEADILYDPTVFAQLGSGKDSLILTSKPLDLDDNVYYYSEKGVLADLSKVKYDIDPEGVMTGIWVLNKGFLKRYNAFVKEIGSTLSEDYEIMLALFSRLKEPIYVKHINDFNWCEIDNEVHLEYALNTVFPKINENNGQ